MAYAAFCGVVGPVLAWLWKRQAGGFDAEAETHRPRPSVPDHMRRRPFEPE